MRLTIQKLILWPKDGSFPPRILEFAADRVNLITGRSRTGKSAITSIIDYVLGSGKCAIPVGPVRTTVGWYGLLLDVGGALLLVAREEPGGRVESGNYCVVEGAVVEIPFRPSKNTNRDALKHRLDLLAGLPSVGSVPDSNAGFAARPSFRDMAAFNFLPQHVVANPYTLLFKADTNEHRQKLRTILPFVLGAVTAEHLLAESELSEAEKMLGRLEAEFARRSSAADVWKAEALGLHGRAIDLGLLAADTPRPEGLDACVRDLASIPGRLDQVPAVPARVPGSTLAALERLESVRAQERTVDRELAELRTRYRRVRELGGALREFSEASIDPAGRVQPVGWLRRNLKPTAPCPTCGSEQDLARERLGKLAEAAGELEARRQAARVGPVALEREDRDLALLVRAQEDLLRQLRVERVELEGARERDGGGQALHEVYRFVGRVEEALKNLRATEDQGELAGRLRKLRARIADLRRVLDPAAARRRLDAALAGFSRSVTHYAEFLDLERRSDAIALKLSELTLVFTSTASGREDYLWEIGSGANWMGYHLAALLAFHELFLSSQRNYVPGFLVIDQPSQVYFPGGWPDDPSAVAGVRASHDVAATRRIFEALGDGLRRTKCRLQIIVTEHADARTLGEMPWVHQVADWHGDDGDYLVPKAWIDGSR